MKLIILLISSLLSLFVNCFHIDVIKTNYKIRSLHATYEEMMEQAKIRKQQRQTGNTISQTVYKKPSAISSPVVEKKKSNLPFDDDMYEHLKFVIAKLTTKIKSDISLTPDELSRFKESIDCIISDATGKDISTNNPSSTIIDNILDNSKTANIVRINDDNEVADPDSPYALLHGKTNTWEVDNMENMTTEEFYDAINKRNSEIRAKLKATKASKEEANEYIDMLNKKNRQ